MQYDICLKCNSQAALIVALAPYGLTTTDETGTTTLLATSQDHALAYAGRVVQTPAEIDQEGHVVAEAIYWPGEYAILRADKEIIRQLRSTPPIGVALLPISPNGLSFGGEWNILE